MKASPAKPGDYFEFFAEMDLLCALSACPGGDLSVPLWGPESVGKDPLDTCNPLGVEVYQPTEEDLKGWTPPQLPQYDNMHGITLPQWNSKK
jgi:uncharacterized protein YcgI (DUF1989 family)